MPDCLGRLLSDFLGATIILALKWRATCSKLGRRGDTLFEVNHAKVAPRCADEFCEDGLSREYDNAVGTSYEADYTDLISIPSLTEKHAFAQKLDSK